MMVLFPTRRVNNVVQDKIINNMKKTLLFLLMFLAAEAKECVLESQKILIPWNVSAIQERAGYNNISVSGAERLFSWQLPSLRRLVYEGEYDRLREEYFPQMDASFKVLNDQDIYISTEKADLVDLVIYYNLSTICASFRLLPGVNNYLAQQDGEKRKSILNKFKSVLYDIHRASCTDITEADMRIGKGEAFPLYVVIQKPGCSSIRLFVLERTNGNIPYYLGFEVKCVSVEEIKSRFEEEKNLRSFYKLYAHTKEFFLPYQKQAYSPIFEILDFTEFYLALKRLSPCGQAMSVFTDRGTCEDRVEDYTIEKIKDIFVNDQW